MGEKKRYVYVITNTQNGKKYVGSTTQPSFRWKSHINRLRAGTHPRSDMQRDYDTFGEVFDFEIVGIDEGFGSTHAEYTVMRARRTYDERYGYNAKDISMRRIRREKLVDDYIVGEWLPFE